MTTLGKVLADEPIDPDGYMGLGTAGTRSPACSTSVTMGVAVVTGDLPAYEERVRRTTENCLTEAIRLDTSQWVGG